MKYSNPRYDAYAIMRTTNMPLPPDWLKPWEQVVFPLRLKADQLLYGRWR